MMPLNVRQTLLGGMKTMGEDIENDDCPLCRGSGEVMVSPDGTDRNNDYYGCPVCLGDEIEKLRTERDALEDKLSERSCQLLTAEACIEQLEAEVAALRKRLVVDDEMVKRALDAFYPRGGPFRTDTPFAYSMRAALKAVLGRGES